MDHVSVAEPATTNTPVRVTVHVTQADIDLGERMDLHQCMVARAMMRTFEMKPHSVWVPIPADPVGGLMIIWPECSHLTLLLPSGQVVETPAVVREQMARFDAGERVAPFSFELEVPA